MAKFTICITNKSKGESLNAQAVAIKLDSMI